MKNNLALVDTKTNEVAVFNGKELLGKGTFDRVPETDEVEEIRQNPTQYLGEVKPKRKFGPEDQIEIDLEAASVAAFDNIVQKLIEFPNK